MNTPVRPAQGALGVRSMLYVSIAAAANRVWAVPATRRGSESASREGHGELNVSMHQRSFRPPTAPLRHARLLAAARLTLWCVAGELHEGA